MTRKFGEIDIDEKKILFMPEGLPGFPGFERFVLLEDPKTKPFCWFQSVETPNLALVVMSPFVFKPDYTLNIEGFILSRNWADTRPEDISIYVVINVAGEGKTKKITANLMGPIIINTIKKEAVQFIMADSSYSHRHNVLDPS